MLSVDGPTLKRLIQTAIRRTGLHVERAHIGQNLYRDIGTIHAPKLIFDVGANIGQSALGFAREFPDARIFCFEPDQRAFHLLQLNSAALPNIECFQAALGPNVSRKMLHLADDSVGNSFLDVNPDFSQLAPGASINSQTGIQVNMTTVDHFCREHALSNIDLLKVDTQGFELEVLKGASEKLEQRSIPVMLLEVEFVQLWKSQPLFDEVLVFLRDRQYRLVGFYNRIHEVDSSLLWCDALFRR